MITGMRFVNGVFAVMKYAHTSLAALLTCLLLICSSSFALSEKNDQDDEIDRVAGLLAEMDDAARPVDVTFAVARYELPIDSWRAEQQQDLGRPDERFLIRLRGTPRLWRIDHSNVTDDETSKVDRTLLWSGRAFWQFDWGRRGLLIQPTRRGMALQVGYAFAVCGFTFPTFVSRHPLVDYLEAPGRTVADRHTQDHLEEFTFRNEGSRVTLVFNHAGPQPTIARMTLEIIWRDESGAEVRVAAREIELNDYSLVNGHALPRHAVHRTAAWGMDGDVEQPQVLFDIIEQEAATVFEQEVDLAAVMPDLDGLDVSDLRYAVAYTVGEREVQMDGRMIRTKDAVTPFNIADIISQLPEEQDPDAALETDAAPDVQH